MKEAAGEANMTVITIVLIAIVLGVGTLIVNNLMKSSSMKAACAEAGGMWVNNSCGIKCSADNAGGYTCQSTLTCSNNNGTWTCS
ncbi:MAG: hypothetical protein IKL65_05900 [Bacilli bacterium]|nr:hypothetical protein [Bacilli bacterium]